MTDTDFCISAIDTTFKLPRDVLTILNTIETAGYEAWCVGGSVRDILMKKTPHDYDIATSAPCQVIEKLFEKTVPTGIKHGTVTAVLNGSPYEITRYRIDGDYPDHRKPKSVSFTACFKEDLARRDFTMNAIGYNPKHGFFDPFLGFKDIKSKLIRTVGNADKRFNEDALRILRAIRFASCLEFEIEKQTADSIKQNATLLNEISAERVKTEIFKALCGSKPSLICELISNRGLVIFGLNHCKSPEKLDLLPSCCELRLAALLLLCDADEKKICELLKCSNAEKKRVASYYRVLSEEPKSLAKLKPEAEFLGYDGVIRGIKACEILYNDKFAEIMDRIAVSMNRNDAFCLKMININGKDLADLGFVGREIGEIQNKLLFEVLQKPELNQAEILKNMARNLKK